MSHPHPAAVAHAPDTAPTRRSGSGLAWLVGIAGGGLALSALYATTGLGLGCPLRSLTGWDCPLCGGTRMGAALLQGDLAAAWYFNPVALIVLVLSALAGVGLIAERVLRRRGALVSAARTVADRLPVALTGQRLGAAFLLGCLGWTLFRNLVLGPLPYPLL